MKLFFVFIAVLYFSVISDAQSWLWGVAGNTPSDAYATSADIYGNGYLAGPFYNSINFGVFHLTSTSSSNDCYVVKFDSLGNVLWASQSKASSTNTVTVNSIASDNYGNVYITGYFNGGGGPYVNFGPYTLITQNMSAFIVKYGPNGNVIWAKESNEPNFHCWSIGLALSTDKAGSVYVGGVFQDTVRFGSQQVISNADGDAFLVKYDSAGNALWARQSNIPSNSSGVFVSSLHNDNMGNVYMVGSSDDTISFPPYTLNTSRGLSYGNIYVVKYDPNGNVLWAHQSTIPSSTSGGLAYSVITDKANNVYITGYFFDTLSFGSNTLLSTSTGVYGDIFLVKYNTAGNLVWVKQSSHVATNNVNGWSGYSLAIDTSDHIYFSGGANFSGGTGHVIFAGETFSYNANTNEKEPSIVMELDTSGNSLCHSFVNTGGDDLNGIACDPSGKYVYFGGDMETTVVFGKDTLYDLSAYSDVDEYPFFARWQPCSSPTDSNSNGKNELCNSLFIPDAFSPNKDGQNDVLYVRSMCISSMDFILFDRWGNKVFESQNLSYGWDGTYKGKPLNTDNFMYYIKATMYDGAVVEKKGVVALVR